MRDRLPDPGAPAWAYIMLAAALALAAGLFAVLAWWQALLVLFGGWFVVDQATRAYLMQSPRHDYKREQAADGDYASEKEREAIALLSRYRVTRWLVPADKRVDVDLEEDTQR